MTGMPAALKARVLADCKQASTRLSTARPWQPKTSHASEARWDAAKAQVTEICAGIAEGMARARANREREQRVCISGTFRRDLLKYAAEVQSRPSPSRLRRHRLENDRERQDKLIAETGYDTAGILHEPPVEQWARPQAMSLYHRLMLRDPGAGHVRDYEGDDLKHLAWMVEAELADITEDGHIWLLSDADAPGRNYPGAPVADSRCKVGRTHRLEEVRALVMETWQAIVDGHPLVEIPAEYRQEMSTPKGIRISGRLIAGHVNRILAVRMDAACHCLGRDTVTYAWDLRDHAADCPGRDRFLHVETVRRAIRSLVLDCTLTRTDGAHLTRRGHTEHRIPAAYAIPDDAGWLEYAARSPRTRHRRWSRLRVRLLGDSRPAPSVPVTESATVWPDPADLVRAA